MIEKVNAVISVSSLSKTSMTHYMKIVGMFHCLSIVFHSFVCFTHCLFTVFHFYSLFEIFVFEYI